MRWGMKGIWLRVISGEKEWMLRLKRCDRHMAHTETAYFSKQAACVRQPDGSYRDFEFWGRDEFSFCLDEEDGPYQEGFGEKDTMYGGGRLYCCSNSSILSREGVALCRALTGGMPLWSGHWAETWESKEE